MSESVLLMGATGTVGGALCAALVDAGKRVRGATRGVCEPLRVPGAEPVHFDLEQPETFPAALDGVHSVFMIARPGDPEPEHVGARLVTAMQNAGVRHVVTLSAFGVERGTLPGLRNLELLVERPGLGYTHLRPNFFMQIFLESYGCPAHRSARRGISVLRCPPSPATRARALPRHGVR